MSYSDCDGCNTTFKYNADGIRISKNYINYLLDGTKIIEESDGLRTIKYLYGEGGVIGFNYNGTIYYYRKNLQGDVIEIYYEDTRLAATYTYDAWGKILEVNDYTNENIAQLNPFRYRSYYYDVETGLYYLNSRYYDPETGRFINEDSLEYLDPENVMGLNLYAYCANNPITLLDACGNSWKSFWKGVGNWFKDAGEWLNKNARNKDGSYALHDNQRFDKDAVFHEQILAFTPSGPSFNLKEGNVGLGSLSIDALTGGWEGEHANLSLLDFGHAEISAEMKNGQISVGALASIWSPSFSVTFFGVTIEVGAEVGSIGAGIDIGKKGFKAKGAYAFGASLSVSW